MSRKKRRRDEPPAKKPEAGPPAPAAADGAPRPWWDAPPQRNLPLALVTGGLWLGWLGFLLVLAFR